MLPPPYPQSLCPSLLAFRKSPETPTSPQNQAPSPRIARLILGCPVSMRHESTKTVPPCACIPIVRMRSAAFHPKGDKSTGARRRGADHARQNRGRTGQSRTRLKQDVPARCPAPPAAAETKWSDTRVLRRVPAFDAPRVAFLEAAKCPWIWYAWAH